MCSQKICRRESDGADAGGSTETRSLSAGVDPWRPGDPSMRKSMHFYRDFLGMDVIQHVPFGCRISLGGLFYIVCLEVKHELDMRILNHFGLDCASKAEVDAW